MISKFGYIGAIVIAVLYFGYYIMSAGGFAAYFSIGATEIIKDVVEAVSLAVVIIVCAVPEGLPLMISPGFDAEYQQDAGPQCVGSQSGRH